MRRGTLRLQRYKNIVELKKTKIITQPLHFSQRAEIRSGDQPLWGMTYSVLISTRKIFVTLFILRWRVIWVIYANLIKEGGQVRFGAKSVSLTQHCRLSSASRPSSASAISSPSSSPPPASRSTTSSTSSAVSY